MIRRSPRSTLVPFTTLFRSGACLVTYFKTRSLDVGMAGNGAIAGLVAITAPSGYVEFWAAPIIGLVAGILVVYAVLAIEKKLDDPRSEEHTSELQSRQYLVCRLLLEKKKLRPM